MPCSCASAKPSGGEVSVIELTGSGRPPLYRHDFEETFYLIEGELTFQLGDKRITRRARTGHRPARRAAYLGLVRNHHRRCPARRVRRGRVRPLRDNANARREPRP